MNLKDAQELALQKMEEHRLLPEWKFRFDNARRRFGQCSYRHQKITLSRYLVERNPQEEVLETILHEIAHALAGPNTHHGPVWQYMARQVGCAPTRCYDSTKVKTPPAKYIGTCPCCGQKWKRHRRPKKSVWCLRCKVFHNYDPQYSIRWEENITEILNDLRAQLQL